MSSDPSLCTRFTPLCLLGSNRTYSKKHPIRDSRGDHQVQHIPIYISYHSCPIPSHGTAPNFLRPSLQLQALAVWTRSTFTQCTHHSNHQYTTHMTYSRRSESRSEYEHCRDLSDDWRNRIRSWSRVLQAKGKVLPCSWKWYDETWCDCIAVVTTCFCDMMIFTSCNKTCWAIWLWCR